MTSNIEECPTGILIDFVGDATASNSPHCEVKKQDSLNGKVHKVESSHGKKETSGCPTLSVNNLGNSCLGDELTNKDERDAWSGWRTPSPTTMNRISEEALRIVDHLDTTLEISIWDEEFPLASTLEEDCSEEYESEVTSHYVASNSLNCNTLSVNVSKTNSDLNKNEGCSNTTEGSFVTANKSSCSSKKSSDESEGSHGSVKESSESVEESSESVEQNSGSVKGSSDSAEEITIITKGSCDAAEEVINASKESSDTAKEVTNATKGSSDAVVEVTNAAKGGSNAAVEVTNVAKGGSDAAIEETNAIKGSSNVVKVVTNVGIYYGSPGISKEMSCVKEHSFDTTEDNSDALEENSGTLEENSNTLDEGSGTVEGSFGTGTLEKKFNVNNKNCIANEKSNEAENYTNASYEKSCDKAGAKTVCAIIEESSLVSGQNSFITKESSTVEEEIKAIAVNSSMITKSSNVGDSKDITGMKQKHLSSESNNESGIKSTPNNKSLNMKSKFGKFVKGSVLKMPINHDKAKEKENVFQASKDKNALSEKTINKIGQLSSGKSILGESNVNGFDILTNKSNIKTPLKSILGKIPFARGENKPNMNIQQDQTKKTVKQLNTPLKHMNSFQFPPASSIKTPLYKSNSVDTPNLVKPIRRSNSFQTRPSIENSYQVKREKSFVAVSHLKTLNSRISLHQPARNGSELKTPSKSSFLPKYTSNTFATPFSSNLKSCAKASQIACPSFGSALKQINTPIPINKQVVDFKRPASTTSKTRFASRLELPSPLPKEINDSIPRRLFPDNTPKKRFN